MGFDASDVYDKAPFTLKLMVREQIYLSKNLFFGFQGGWNYKNLSNKDLDYKSSMHTLRLIPMVGLTLGERSKINMSIAPSGGLLVGYHLKQSLGDDLYYEYRYKDMNSDQYNEFAIGLSLGIELALSDILRIGVFYNMSLSEHFEDLTEHQITFRIPITLYKEFSRKAN